MLYRLVPFGLRPSLLGLIYRHVYRREISAGMCKYIRIDMRTDMCTDKCADICADVCIDKHTHQTGTQPTQSTPYMIQITRAAAPHLKKDFFKIF